MNNYKLIQNKIDFLKRKTLWKNKLINHKVLRNNLNLIDK